jgi:hypothetical protein
VGLSEGGPAAKPPLIDRIVAPFGARALVAGRPRMGWLLTEVAPAQLWTSLTGALWLDGYNLVLYLTLLGATLSELAWLPLVNYAGIALHVLIVALRPPRGDAKATCIAYTFLARSLWLGTVLWPLLAWWLGLGGGAVLAGVFAAIFATAMFGNVGVAAFMTWTAAVVPNELRGRFFMWRNLGAFGLVNLALQGVAWAWPVSPSGAVADPAELPWVMGLMGAATVLVILSTFPLSWSPDMPARAAHEPPHPPLRAALAGRNDFKRLVAMGGLNTAAMACVLPYLPRLLQHLGVDGKHYALLQGNVQLPLMLAGIVLAGVALRRLGAWRLMAATALVTLAGDATMLLLTPANLGWLVAVALAVTGLARGLASITWFARVIELAPAHDTRFPMLAIAANGCAGMLAGAALMAAVPWLEARQADPVWAVVAAGAALRVGALVLAWWPQQAMAGRR